jgi:hypothetical protein
MSIQARMRHVLKLLSLLLLLVVAQQGAVVHELSHLAPGKGTVKVSSSVLDSSCAQCPAFAQVATPAFSHSFPIPSLVRTAFERSSEPMYAAVDAAVPRPRSRGPPV